MEDDRRLPEKMVALETKIDFLLETMAEVKKTAEKLDAEQRRMQNKLNWYAGAIFVGSIFASKIIEKVVKF